MVVIGFAQHQNGDQRERRHNAQRDAEPRPKRVVANPGQEPIEQRPSDINEDNGDKDHDICCCPKGLVCGKGTKFFEQN